MLTFQQLYERCSSIASDDTATSVALFKAFINETHKLVCRQEDWWFLELTKTYTTTASQQEFTLPRGFNNLESFCVTVGNSKHYTRESANLSYFNRVNYQGTNNASDHPLYHNFRGNKLRVFPAIASAGLTAILEYTGVPVDMVEDDYSTGTITGIANGDTTVTGSGTTWTDAMVGRYIRITNTGEWYKIASRTSNTEIELETEYEGTTISGGSESYLIGELPLLPDGYENLLVYRALGLYYLKKEELTTARSYYSEESRSPGLYESLYKSMKESEASRTNEIAWSMHKGIPGDPNLDPNNITIT